MTLNREQFFAMESNEYCIVEIPGGQIRMRAMTIADQLSYEAADKKEQDIIFRILVACCVDDEGNNLFTMDDVEKLNTVNAKVICHLFKEAVKLNSLTQTSVEDEAKK